MPFSTAAIPPTPSTPPGTPASKEPGVRRFIERLSELRGRYPDLRVLAYNGFTTDLSFIGSVDPNRRGLAVSPFWAQAVDYSFTAGSPPG